MTARLTASKLLQRKGRKCFQQQRLGFLRQLEKEQERLREEELQREREQGLIEKRRYDEEKQLEKQVGVVESWFKGTPCFVSRFVTLLQGSG